MNSQALFLVIESISSLITSIHSLWFGELTASWKKVGISTFKGVYKKIFRSIWKYRREILPCSPSDPRTLIICLSSWGVPSPFPNLWRITLTIPLRYEILYMWTYHMFKPRRLGASHIRRLIVLKSWWLRTNLIPLSRQIFRILFRWRRCTILDDMTRIQILPLTKWWLKVLL